jgi:triacylglycerol lipase
MPRLASLAGVRSSRASRFSLRKSARAVAVAAALTASLAAPAQAGLLDWLLPSPSVQVYTQTKYPIVLVHGLFGFDNVAGIDYFYGIPAELRNGGAQVFVASVSSFNSSEARGEQLLKEIKTLLASTGAKKVNLIGHSQGGPTARYVAGVAPELVASVTTIAGVNKGSKIADLVGRFLPAGSFSEAVVVSATTALGNVIGFLSGRSVPEVPLEALKALSTAGTATFNAKFPQGLPTGCTNGPELVNGVRYYSWTGSKGLTNILDISDPAMGVLNLLHGEPNDGLVSVCSSRLGTSLGVYSQNHLDEINQLFGLRDIFDVNPVTLYRDHANRLKGMGL